MIPARRKVVVYTIAKNEVRHASRFMRALRGEADQVVVLDTGSTDGTVAALRAEGAVVYEARIDPFRFDDARNASLALVPEDADICVCLDLDEVLFPGWRAVLDQVWSHGITRLHYHYTWNFNPDGSPGLTFEREKIHARYGYRWKHPVHEILVPIDGFQEKIETTHEIRVEHHADNFKSRNSYLPLLELSVREDPLSDRNSHYLVREYTFYQKWNEAIAEGHRYLALPTATWKKERAKTMRLMARAYRNLNDVSSARAWLYRAVAEDQDAREGYLDLAELLLAENEMEGARYFALRALAIPGPDLTYLRDPEAWTWKPHDLLAVASYYLGQYEAARTHGRIALEHQPEDNRLRNNLECFEAAQG